MLGTPLAVGDAAPPFTLEWLPAPADEVREIELSSTAGDVRLLHVVHSVDTPVCHRGLHRFDELNARCPTTSTSTRSAWTCRTPRRG